MLAAALTSGCVPYPVYKTLRPAARVTVLGQADQPLAQAQATLVSNAYPYGFEKRRETQETAADGTASFNALKEWRTESLMIHGAEVFFWNWCVRKEGYATFFTQHKSGRDFEAELLVRLRPGDSIPCPKDFR